MGWIVQCQKRRARVQPSFAPQRTSESITKESECDRRHYASEKLVCRDSQRASRSSYTTSSSGRKARREQSAGTLANFAVGNLFVQTNYPGEFGARARSSTDFSRGKINMSDMKTRMLSTDNDM